MKPIRLVLIFLFFYSSQATANQVDSLLLVLEKAKGSQDIAFKYTTHFSLGEAYYSGGTEDYEQALYHFEIAYNIATTQKAALQIGASQLQIGLCHQRRNNYQKALKYYFAYIDLSKEQIELPEEAKVYSQISSIYRSLGDYDQAFKYQMLALSQHEIQNDSLGIANSFYNLGSIFYYQDQYQSALDYYLNAKEIIDALKNDRFNFSCLAALGSVYNKLGNYEMSLKCNQESLDLAKKLKYQTGIAYALGNIATNLTAKEDFVKAEQFLKESIAIKLEVEDKWGAIGTYIDFAKLYLKWDKPNQAIPKLKRSLEMAIEVDSKTRQPEIYQLLAEVYDKKQEPIIAYRYTKKYIALKDSLLNEKTVEKMSQTKRRYEVVKHEHEVHILKKENELLGKNKKIQKQQFYIFAIASFAFLLFLWWYKNKLKLQNKVNGLLAEKYEILNAKNEEIHIKNKQLEHSNEDLQQFAYVASHDLKEPLRMIGAYSNLLDKRYKAVLDDSGQEFLYYITDAVSRMGTLLDDLLDFSRAGTQATPTKMIPVENVLFLVESNLRHLLDDCKGTLIINIQDFPAIKAHQTQLLQLFQNLISNGLKFTVKDRAPVVEVTCECKDGQYIFSIKDNGIGISEKNLEKVFEMFRRLHTREEYEGTGIGLATCKRIVSTWGGDIWVESVEGEGSTFLFTVPLSMTAPMEKKAALLNS